MESCSEKQIWRIKVIIFNLCVFVQCSCIICTNFMRSMNDSDSARVPWLEDDTGSKYKCARHWALYTSLPWRRTWMSEWAPIKNATLSSWDKASRLIAQFQLGVFNICNFCCRSWWAVAATRTQPWFATTDSCFTIGMREIPLQTISGKMNTQIYY